MFFLCYLRWFYILAGLAIGQKSYQLCPPAACVFGGTLTDFDGSLSEMQLGKSCGKHASAQAFASISERGQECAFNTVRPFPWKSELERALQEARYATCRGR